MLVVNRQIKEKEIGLSTPESTRPAPSRSRLHGAVAFAFLAAGFVAAMPERAMAVPQPPPSSIDETDGGQFPFGTYDQNSSLITACSQGGESDACGPVSAINSLVYLQNRFPNFYADPKPMLVPDTTPAAINGLANTLATAMGCTCGNGTTPEGLATGLRGYINGHETPNTKTDVTEVDNPSIDWLMGELYDRENVELSVDLYKKNADGTYSFQAGHWITATGAATHDTNGNGYFDSGDTPESLSFVDPGGDGSAINSGQMVKDQALGSTGAVNHANLLQLPDFDWGTLDVSPGSITVITAAVSESPERTRIPEPSGMAVLTVGLAALLGCGVVRGKDRAGFQRQRRSRSAASAMSASGPQ